MKQSQTYTHLETILEELSNAPQPEPVSVPGVIVGQLVAFDAETGPRIDFQGNPAQSPVSARSTIPLTESIVGKKVTLMFENASPAKPIIMGILINQSPYPTDDRLQPEQDQAVSVRVDGERLVLKAKEEIVLECGKASITLTKAGKVLIRGEYVLSRSAGANKIKGGSVQIN